MLSGLVDNYHPNHKNRIKSKMAQGEISKSPEIIQVQCLLFNSILEQHNIYHIDYLTIDTEGNEYEILKTIDFNKYKIDVIDVENNYRETKVKKLLLEKGYCLVESLLQDDIYMRLDEF